MTKTLVHVTLDTGHALSSARTEARSGSIALMRTSLATAVRATPALEPVPYRPGYAFLATVERAGLLVTLVRVTRHGPSPVVTFGVAVDDTYADLWTLLHRQRGEMRGAILQTEPGDPPRPPWLAARLEAGATSVPSSDLMWMADFERTVAWAWLETNRDARE